MVEFSFDRDEFRPDPDDRRREAERRSRQEAERDRQQQEESARQQFERERFEREMRQAEQEQAVRRMVNDPELTVDETLAAVINDPSMTMDRNMVVRRRNGFDTIRRSGQFANLALGIDIKPQKRKRKKTKTDKTMKAALTQANKELRKKNGQLRKGVTQADIMRRAHRIRRKMS